MTVSVFCDFDLLTSFKSFHHILKFTVKTRDAKDSFDFQVEPKCFDALVSNTWNLIYIKLLSDVKTY